MREIIFDTETTGLDSRSGDRMVEIGCVEMVGRVETGNTYHAYFNPERDMPKAAENIHGLSGGFLSDKPLFAQKAAEILEYFGDAPLVAHNANFDFGFLNMELEKCGLEPIPATRMVDTVALARKRHPGAKLSLDALCSRYGIDRSHRVKHGALLDAELLAQVYVELTGGRQIGLELAPDAPKASGHSQSQSAKNGLPQAGQQSSLTDAPMPDAGQNAPLRQPRAPRPHSASAEELRCHSAFISGIESPLWES